MTTNPNPSPLLALADRCEAASGPDRELDCLIAAAAHPSMRGEFRVVGPPTYDPERYFSNPDIAVDWIGYDLLNHAPAYTASIDTALMLVPEGHDVQISLFFGRDGEGSAVVSPLKRIGLPKTFAATPPLALCAAALRAQASETGRG